MDWDSLPTPALYSLMSYVPVRDRFASCALVCSNWAEAAVAVTDSIVLPQPSERRVRSIRDKDPDVASLHLWLATHGSNLQQLHCKGRQTWVIAHPAHHWRQLPCPNLQGLLLQNCTLGSGGHVCSNIAAATGLTSLVLDEITAPNESELQQLLASVTALPALQHLNVGTLKKHQAPDRYADTFDLPATFLQELQQLPQLTHLQLGWSTPAACLRQLGGLTRLQHVDLRLAMAVQLDCLSGLQELQGLTYLGLSGVQGSLAVLSPGFSTLTGLQELLLPACRISASDIAGMTGLQRLELASASCVAAAAEQLLAVVAQLQHLTELVLDDFRGLEACPAQAYTALTASSKLQRLCLAGLLLASNGEPETAFAWQSFFEASGVLAQSGEPRDDPLVWQHIFPASSVRPQLTALILSRMHPCLAAADLQRLVRCCPALQILQLNRVVASGVQLAMLQQLPSLRELRLDGTLFDTAAHDVAQLVELQHLAVQEGATSARTGEYSRPAAVQVTAVKQLTALQQLTVLDLTGCSSFVGSYHETLRQQLYEFTLLAPPGAGEDDKYFCQIGRFHGFCNKVGVA